MPTMSHIMAHKTSWLRPVVHLLKQIAITRCRKHLTEIKARNSKLLYFQRHEVNWYTQDTWLDRPWSPTEHREISARARNWIPVIHPIDNRYMTQSSHLPPIQWGLKNIRVCVTRILIKSNRKSTNLVWHAIFLKLLTHYRGYAYN